MGRYRDARAALDGPGFDGAAMLPSGAGDRVRDGERKDAHTHLEQAGPVEPLSASGRPAPISPMPRRLGMGRLDLADAA